MPIVKNPGTPIELGGVAYVMPPLSLGAIEQMGDKFTEMVNAKKAAATFRAENFGPMIDMIHASLQRNYPELDRSIVAFGLDLGNLEATFQALMKTSGLVRDVETARSDTSGEAPAATAG